MTTLLRIALLLAMLGLWVIGILFLIHVRELQATVRTLMANFSPQAPPLRNSPHGFPSVIPHHGYGYLVEGQIQQEGNTAAAFRRAVADERPVGTT